MEFRRLGRTDIEVSVICLGTMTWGEQNSESEAHQQLDYALDHQVNFIDTAEMYPVPPKPDTYTTTESYIGNWLKARGHRDKVVLASKAAGPAIWTNYIRDGELRFNRKHLSEALEASLKRLQTDYLDLYQLHWPERSTNYFGKLDYEHQQEQGLTPLLETLEVLNEFVKAGKIRHYGLSNETPWGAMKYLQVAEQHQLPRAVSIQNPYNLLNRSYEIGLAEVSHREDIGLLAYSPMAFGALSGKYLGGKRPAGARLTLFDRFTRYTSTRAEQATQAYVDLAHQHGLSPAQMALAFVNQRPFVTSNIIGATTMAQLQENIGSADIVLPTELYEALGQVHQDNPNPCP